MKVCFKNKKNYLKVLISFFLSVVVFCSFNISVFSASETVSANSIYIDNSIAYYNSTYTAYCVYYNSDNTVSISYSAGAHFFKYSNSKVVPCDVNGSYLACRYIKFNNLETAVEFLTNYSAEKFADAEGNLTFEYLNNSVGFTCDYTQIIYNNRKVYSSAIPNDSKLLLEEQYMDGYDKNGLIGGIDPNANILEKILHGIKSIPEKFFEAISLFKDKLIDVLAPIGEAVSSIFDKISSFFTLREGQFDSFKLKVSKKANDSESLGNFTYLMSRLIFFFEDTYHTGNAWDLDIEITPPFQDLIPEMWNGGKTYRINFNWFKPYRAYIKDILSVFMWVSFAWGIYCRLPDILNGAGMIYSGAVNYERGIEKERSIQANERYKNSYEYYRDREDRKREYKSRYKKERGG